MQCALSPVGPSTMRSAAGCPVRVALIALAAVASLRAQCNLGWAAGPGLAGTDGEVHAMTWWDPDGAGPRTPVVVMGGSF